MKQHESNIALVTILAAGLVACSGADPDGGANDGTDEGSAGAHAGGGDGSGGNGSDSDQCPKLWGSLTEPETLAGCYRVMSDVVIHADVTVEPGATFIFDAQTRMVVAKTGSLVAAGTAAEPIVFTAAEPERGTYEGLVFQASYDSANLLEHVVVEYAGYADHDYSSAVRLEEAPVRLSIRNTTFRHNDSVGLRLRSDAELGDFSANRFEDNLYAVALPTSALSALDRETVYAGNDNDAVWVYGRTAASDGTWKRLDVPYHITGTHVVTGAVEIEPGATFVARQDALIRVRPGGSLSAVGTADEPIVFTADDPLPGFWTGLWYDSTVSSHNVVAHVIVDYAGAPNDQLPAMNITDTMPAAGVIVSATDGNCTVRIESTLVRHSSQWGVFVRGLPVFGGLATVLGDYASMEFEDNAAGKVGASGDYDLQW